MKRAPWVLLLLAVVPGVALPQQGDAVRGRQLAQTTCLPCHGAQGIGANPTYPHLARQGIAYLVKQLNDFKSGKRKNAIMSGVAAGLSPQQMADVAAFYASQPSPSGAAVSEKRVALGEAIYRGGIASVRLPACTACHGPGGRGIAPGFPRLAPQQPAYLQTQLQNFKNGKRSNDLNGMMRDIAAKLSPEQMAALAAYLSAPSRSFPTSFQ